MAVLTRRGTVLLIALLSPSLITAQECNASGGGSSYTGDFEALGCYNDSSVSLLGDLKVSTVAMTPQYCADFCGARGYEFGGIIFTTQCFCDAEVNYQGNDKIPDASCNAACVTAPEESCGGGYVTSLIQITNPQPAGLVSNAFKPACQLSPLCSLDICDTSLPIAQRVASLVNELTLSEKILNLVDAAAGSERIGLPSYEWWNEATHGVGSAPGVQFPDQPANYSYATSFPSPITSAAAFDIELIAAIGAVVGREGRAFGNGGYAGFDYWAPNMNPFRDPRWGRGQETPGEDILVVQNYVRGFVPGLQGPDPLDKLTIATCKHYAVYDLETGRYGNNYDPTLQDLADYYLPPFKTCVRDVGVGSVMCAYNAVLGYPSCSNPYLLEEVLRDHWNFTQDYHYVVGDCGAVADIHDYHNFTNTLTGAASVALNAGTDLDCGQTFIKLNESLARHQTTEDRLDEALTRLYNALFTVGFFDGSAQYGSLDFSDVGTPDAMQLAYTAAVEGMTLLKNDDILPLAGKKTRKVAVIGPYANATTQMQGTYSGPPKKITSPLEAFNGYAAWDVTYALGTDIDTNDTSGFKEAVNAAKNADVVIFLGGIDGSQESETLDRTTLTWPGNQLDLINRLSRQSAPVIVVQFGGGQLDDSALVENDNVKGLIWAGYPSQDGGPALLDVMTGKQSIAGRLPITQYPASYASEVSIFDINLRYNDTYPGRTYQWYTGTPIFPFGFGLHYTTFSFAWTHSLKKTYNIASLVHACRSANGVLNDATPWTTVSISVTNTGVRTSDYSGLLFLSSPNAGPAPRPLKTLISYNRLHAIGAGESQTLDLPLTLASIARADENGDVTIWPGRYKVVLDVGEGVLEGGFELVGERVVIDTLPAPQRTYDFAVPVRTQAPSYQAYS